MMRSAKVAQNGNDHHKDVDEVFVNDELVWQVGRWNLLTVSIRDRDHVGAQFKSQKKKWVSLRRRVFFCFSLFFSIVFSVN